METWDVGNTVSEAQTIQQQTEEGKGFKYTEG